MISSFSINFCPILTQFQETARIFFIMILPAGHSVAFPFSRMMPWPSVTIAPVIPTGLWMIFILKCRVVPLFSIVPFQRVIVINMITILMLFIIFPRMTSRPVIPDKIEKMPYFFNSESLLISTWPKVLRDFFPGKQLS